LTFSEEEEEEEKREEEEEGKWEQGMRDAIGGGGEGEADFELRSGRV
jgi:hypothetical protein